MNDDTHDDAAIPSTKRHCIVDGCDSPVRCRDRCKKHYDRWRDTELRYTVTCEQCGLQFDAPRSTRRFCSRRCFERYRVNYPKKRPCQVCGTEFEILTPADSRRRYCSPECKARRSSAQDYIKVTLCSVGDCEDPVASHGMCVTHWLRMQRRGTTDLAVRTSKPWVDKKTGYVQVKIPGKRSPVQLHRVLMEQYLSRPLRPGETVHHKNGIRNDNRQENLELWVSWQPAGSRVSDLLEFAREVIRTYASEEDFL